MHTDRGDDALICAKQLSYKPDGQIMTVTVLIEERRAGNGLRLDGPKQLESIFERTFF